MSSIQIFDFQEFSVRVLGTWDCPAFVAKDVCAVLGLSNVSQACESLDEDEKLIYVLDISGQNRDTLCITESGLYSLIFRSRKKQAKVFRKWVTSEVLPSIRKTGEYRIEPDRLPPTLDQKIRLLEMGKELAEQMQDDRVKVKLMASIVNELAPVDEPQAAKLYSVTEVLERHGFKIPDGKDSAIGRKVAAAWRAAKECEPQVCEKAVGTGHHTAKIKVYPEEFFERIVTIAQEYLG